MWAPVTRDLWNETGGWHLHTWIWTLRSLILYESTVGSSWIIRQGGKCLNWGICQLAPKVRISPSFCCVTSEKLSGTGRLQPSTWCTCGGSLRGTDPFSLSGSLCSLTLFPILCLYVTQPKPSSAALVPESLNQQGLNIWGEGQRPWSLEPDCLEPKVSWPVHTCVCTSVKRASAESSPLHLRCYHYTLKYSRASTPSLMILWGNCSLCLLLSHWGQAPKAHLIIGQRKWTCQRFCSCMQVWWVMGELMASGLVLVYQ